MKITVVLKGTIRNKKKVLNDLSQLQKRFNTLEVLETRQAGHAVTLAANAAENGADCIIAAGGDGTINEVLNGIMQGSTQRSELPILGYLLCGTANDFAKTVGIDGSIEQLIQLLETTQANPIDIGKVSYLSPQGEEDERYFINITDVGLGGHVVEKVNKSSKPLGANFTFIKAITESFITYEQSKVTCTTDSFEWEGKILTLAVANGKYFGSGLCIAPDAQVNDGKFSVVIIADIKMKDYLLNVGKIKKGKKVDHPKISYREATEVTITPHELSCAVDMDGEFLGYAPIHITMVPHAIQFLMP